MVRRSHKAASIGLPIAGRSDRKTNTASQTNLIFAIFKKFGANGATKAFTKFHCSVSIGLSENHEKFITTIARTQINRANVLTNDATNFSQDKRTKKVIVTIVDGFKIIHVHHDHTNLTSKTTTALQLRLDTLIDRAHVKKAGEIIGIHQLF